MRQAALRSIGRCLCAGFRASPHVYTMKVDANVLRVHVHLDCSTVDCGTLSCGILGYVTVGCGILGCGTVDCGILGYGTVGCGMLRYSCTGRSG